MTIPYGPQALLKLSPETPYVKIKGVERHVDTTHVTRFAAPDGRTFLMVVNCDYRKDRTLHADAPFAMERLDPAAGTWSSVGASFDLDLVRGGGVILRAAK